MPTAALAGTLTISRTDLWGNTYVHFGSFTFSSSYGSAGEAANPGLRVIEKVEVDQVVNGYVIAYDYTNKKLRAYRSGAVSVAGTISTPTFTGGAASLTATASAPAFTGGAASLTATSDTPTFTGGAASLTATANAPAFTGGAASLTATASAPAFTGGAASLTATSSAPTFTGTASTATLLLNYNPGGGDIKGSVTVDVAIAGGTLPTNGNLVSTLAAANNTTDFTIALQADIPRNVGIAFKNTNAGASTGNAVGCVITGTFRGAAQTETISFSAAELTSTAQNEVATKYGIKPFDTITSITNPVAQPANWQHGAGPGSKLGFPVNSATGANADFKKLTKDAADLAVGSLVDHTNKTINYGTLADGADVAALYLIEAADDTPVGTNSTPTITPGAYTPAGTVAAPTITPGAYTPAGTVAAPTITPGAYTPAGTVSAPTLTGTTVAAGPLAEVTAGVNLSGVTVKVVFYGQ